jgi:cysteinyl-tRNA synthetase
MKFLETMDDDFNTAGAIAALHELAGEINSFIEQSHVERERHPDLIQAVLAATVTLRNLGRVLGLFRGELHRAQSTDASLAERLMAILIMTRNEARKNRDFALAGRIRNALGEIGVILEDRGEGTVWRKV